MTQNEAKEWFAKHHEEYDQALSNWNNECYDNPEHVGFTPACIYDASPGARVGCPVCAKLIEAEKALLKYKEIDE
jgi:hypothetical protein